MCNIFSCNKECPNCSSYFRYWSSGTVRCKNCFNIIKPTIWYRALIEISAGGKSLCSRPARRFWTDYYLSKNDIGLYSFSKIVRWEEMQDYDETYTREIK